ncbi:hypothetical protein Gotur_031077 [Gossypium turneri]
MGPKYELVSAIDRPQPHFTVYFRFNAYVFTEGNTDFAEEASGYGRKWVRQRGYEDDNVVSPWRYVCKCEYGFPKLVNFKKDDEDDLVRASLFTRWLTCLFLPVHIIKFQN